MGEYIAVKFIDEEQGSIEGLGAPYYGPSAGKDLTGEYFDKDTDFCPDWFKVRPLLYHHGLDPVIKTAPIGQITEWALKDEGLWVKGQLDKSNRYWEQIKALIKAGKLYFSSGGLSHLVEKEPNGHIKKWPWVEQSLTPTPANPMAEFAFKSIIMQAGPSAAAIKALAPEIAELATQAGIDLDKINENEIMSGYQDEQEHNDVTGGDPLSVMKIVATHLKEDPEYYSKIQAAVKEDYQDQKSIENIDKENGMQPVKMEKPQGAPGFAPDPAIPAEAQGLKPGEQKAPPPECPVKAMKCLHCGKAIVLPQETLDALQALITSAQQALAMGGGQGAPANGPAEAPAIPADGVAPSQPGISQGMAPETHADEVHAPGVKPEEKIAPAVPAPEKEGPGPEETPAHEAAEGPMHEAIEGPEKEKEEDQSAVKALLASVEAKVKTAVEEATKPLRERINTLESEPANGGPLRRAVKTTDNFKMGNESSPATDRATAIKTIIETTDNESLKQSLGFELAMLQMKGVVEKGPQAPNG